MSLVCSADAWRTAGAALAIPGLLETGAVAAAGTGMAAASGAVAATIGVAAMVAVIGVETAKLLGAGKKVDERVFDLLGGAPTELLEGALNELGGDSAELLEILRAIKEPRTRAAGLVQLGALIQEWACRGGKLDQAADRFWKEYIELASEHMTNFHEVDHENHVLELMEAHENIA
jgi:hypothetical protein